MKAIVRLGHIIKKKITQELKETRIGGPFNHLSIQNVGGEYCLIHNLSHPRGRSVNDGIDPADTGHFVISVDTSETRYARLADQ